MLLSSVDAGSIPVQGTAIGEALGAAMRCFEGGDRKHKAVVLFTDGEDHVADPVDQADVAAAQGVRIYAIGVGTAAGDLIPVLDQDGP